MTCQTITDDIDKYLKTIKNIISFHSNDFIISTNREVNLNFLSEYALKRKDIIEIINSLTSNHFIEKVANNHINFKDEFLYIFGITINLTNTKGKTKKVPIYIKFNLLKQKVILVSFHEARYKLKGGEENEN